MKIKNIVNSFFLALLLSFVWSVSCVCAQSIEVEDSFSGLPVSVTISNLDVSSSYYLVLESPNMERNTFSFKSSTDVYSFIMEKEYFLDSGDYTFYLQNQDFDLIDDISISLYSNIVSDENSFITPENEVLSSSNLNVVVYLYDDFMNPVSGHFVKLIPSSADVEIESDSSFSDSEGKVSFDVDLGENDLISFSAYDLTSDVLLSSRANVVVSDSISSAFDSQNMLSYVGNSSGAVDSLIFDDVPDEIFVNDFVNLAVTAVDSDDQVVTSYEGSVRFSVLSDNSDMVSLPSDYTFISTDQGSHLFSLVFSFQQEGEYEIEVRDLDNPDIYGVYNFTVVKPSSFVSAQSEDLLISNPLPGTYSNNVQVISGTANPGEALKIFDNDIHLSSVTADINGDFSYTTPALVDGEHNFYLAVYDADGVVTDTSDVLTFFVDTSAPEIERLDVFPEGDLHAGESVVLNLYMKEELSQAALLFDDGIYDFVYDSVEDMYFLEFNLPNEAFEYSADLLLVDLLNNESKFSDYLSFDVLEAEIIDVPNVENLTSESSDSKITLNWDPVLMEESEVAIYKIYYGLSADSLNNVVETFTNYNSWYIPNLENGTEYYFAVTAVDALGNESVEFSNIVFDVPNPSIVDVEDPDITHGSAGSEVLGELDDEISETGPEVLFLLPISILLTYFYFRFFGRKKNYYVLDF